MLHVHNAHLRIAPAVSYSPVASASTIPIYMAECLPPLLRVPLWCCDKRYHNMWPLRYRSPDSLFPQDCSDWGLYTSISVLVQLMETKTFSRRLHRVPEFGGYCLFYWCCRSCFVAEDCSAVLELCFGSWTWHCVLSLFEVYGKK